MRSRIFICSLLLIGAAQAATASRVTEALDLQRALAAQNPGDAEVLNDLGNLYGLAGRFGDAEAAYRAAISADPNHATAHYNLALALQESEQLDEAATLMERAVELAPTNPRAHYQLGNIYLQRGDRALAVASFASAFRAQPDLALPSVNPQVIDNPVLTEAMLQAYQRRSRAALAPRAYDQPDKITLLLVPEQEMLAQPEEEAEAEAPREPAQRNLVTPSKPMFKPPPATEAEKRNREKQKANDAFGGSKDLDGWGDGWDDSAWGDPQEDNETWEDFQNSNDRAKERRQRRREDQNAEGAAGLAEEAERQRRARDDDGDGSGDS